MLNSADIAYVLENVTLLREKVQDGETAAVETARQLLTRHIAITTPQAILAHLIMLEMAVSNTKKSHDEAWKHEQS